MNTISDRCLIINCDDLGMNETIDDAAFEIYDQGIITSISVMPTGQSYSSAIRKAKTRGITEIGVHLSLTSEYENARLTPVSLPHEIPSLLTNSNNLIHDMNLEWSEKIDLRQAELELNRQVNKILNDGFEITHIDGHMFFYDIELGGHGLFSIAAEIAKNLSVPFRHRNRVLKQRDIGTYMIWDGYSKHHHRIGYYKDFLYNYEDDIAELIIHPGKSLLKMSRFTGASGCRFSDYIFFKSKYFKKIIRQRNINILSWKDISAIICPM